MVLSAVVPPRRPPSPFEKTTTRLDKRDARQGQNLVRSLAPFLQYLRHHDDGKKAVLDPNDVQRVEHCFARGNPEPEYLGPVHRSRIYHHLTTVMESLQHDPTQRTFVVDHQECVERAVAAGCTEDATCLSLSKWQVDCKESQHIIFCITTIRSLERQVLQRCYQNSSIEHGTWKVHHATGPRGTALLQHNTGAAVWCLLSDQPRHVANVGLDLAAVHPHTHIVRVFRCAPRANLRPGMRAVLQQDAPSNVFDVWVRHHETPVNLITSSSFGRFRHDLSVHASVREWLLDLELPGFDGRDEVEATASSVASLTWTSSSSVGSSTALTPRLINSPLSGFSVKTPSSAVSNASKGSTISSLTLTPSPTAFDAEQPIKIKEPANVNANRRWEPLVAGEAEKTFVGDAASLSVIFEERDLSHLDAKVNEPDDSDLFQSPQQTHDHEPNISTIVTPSLSPIRARSASPSRLVDTTNSAGRSDPMLPIRNTARRRGNDMELKERVLNDSCSECAPPKSSLTVMRRALAVRIPPWDLPNDDDDDASMPPVTYHRDLDLPWLVLDVHSLFGLSPCDDENLSADVA